MARGLGELGTVVIIALIAFIIIIGGNLFYGEIFTNSGVSNYSNLNDTSGYSGSYAKINAVAANMSISMSNSTNNNANPQLVLISGAFNAFLNTFTVMDALGSFASGLIGSITNVGGISLGPMTVILLGVIGIFFAWRLMEAATGRSV